MFWVVVMVAPTDPAEQLRRVGFFLIKKKTQIADRKMAVKVALNPFICRRDDRSGIMPKT